PPHHTTTPPHHHTTTPPHHPPPPPTTEQFRNLNITSTPHIGASTKEAQLKAGLDTVENVKKILSGDYSVTL
ncbi:MAG: hypothetical protein CL496_02995, partial [Actinobacteria bacterium]|nr:hypothetical protein [Actinomycetota bacterium]